MAIIFCRGSKGLEASAAGRITARPWFCARSRSKLATAIRLQSLADPKSSGDLDAERGAQAGLCHGLIRPWHHDRQPFRLPDDRSEPGLWSRLPDSGDLVLRSARGAAR